MSEIIDILTPNSDELSTFTVSNVVNFVNVVNFIGPSILYCANGFSRFQRGDCFTILSAGYFIPERFVLWSQEDAAHNTCPRIALSGLHGGVHKTINTFGNAGVLKLPFPNYEFSIGTFNDSEENLLVTPAGFQLECSFPFPADILQISMVDVPAAINGIVFKLIPFIKVLHNFSLAL